MSDVYRWADLTSDELAALADDNAVAVRALGAIEQHGPHLPLSTDVDIAEGLLDAAIARLRRDAADDRRPVLVLPTLAAAASLEHIARAGTLSLAAETVIAELTAVGESIARAGIRRMVWLNAHGGNRPAMDIAALRLRAAHAMLVVKIHYPRIEPPPDVLADAEFAHGLHGGALETALMRHLAPDRVREGRVADFPPHALACAQAGQRIAPSGAAAFAWMADDLNAAGVAGDARAGDTERGAVLVEHYARAIAQTLREAGEFDLARLADRPNGRLGMPGRSL